MSASVDGTQHRGESLPAVCKEQPPFVLPTHVPFDKAIGIKGKGFVPFDAPPAADAGDG